MGRLPCPDPVRKRRPGGTTQFCGPAVTVKCFEDNSRIKELLEQPASSVVVVPGNDDAAALIMLAMQAAGSSESGKLKDKVMDVANAPGEKIYPGELAKALKIIKDGGDVDYVGASAVELIGPGESAGNYREVEIKDGAIAAVKYR